ncbi:MAG: (2Fe-2S)-binding protein [Planctomycetaceae bacterium]
MPRVAKLRINGAEVPLDADAVRSLLSVLRDDLGLTGAKYGCGEGACGACTVLIDGEATRSCITAVGGVADGEITTIEGLERDGELHPLQQAFLDHDAMQCGYCTCGMILAGAAFLKKNAAPARDDVVRELNGNICRCGAYPRIIAACLQAAGKMREREPAAQQR